MEIVAIFCKDCGNIIYSRSNHDFRSCDCGGVSIDDLGRRLLFKDTERKVNMLLDGEVLLSQILHYDYMCGNGKIPEEYLSGWHGKFRIREGVDLKFYEKLVGKVSMLEIISYLADKKINVDR